MAKRKQVIDINHKVYELNILTDQIYTFTVNYYSKNYIVMCEGNIFSNTVIIAEALGALEEKYKRILIGRSGSLVRNILKKYCIDKKVMLLNVVPWRPFSNKTPEIKDIRNYLPFWRLLFEKLDITNILCLGAIAKKLLLFSKDNFNAPNVNFTWHPAFYLRTNNNNVIQDIENKILDLKNLIDNRNQLCYLHFVR